MASELKAFFDRARVIDIAESLVRAHPSFPKAAFVRDATRGLEALELMDRARHIMEAMRTHLPPRYEEALRIVLRSLGTEVSTFKYWPHTMFVATYGTAKADFERSMAAQRILTERWSCEFSIRPFLEKYPDETLAVLRDWVRDPNEHVRRLVSEGTRPLLPWAPRVRWLQREPKRLRPLLEALKDDESEYVRRSVANHLNDVAKAHPDLVCDVADRWMSKERRSLVRHALRTLVKRGHPRALAILGFGGKPRVVARGKILPARVAIGGKTRVEVTLTSTSPQRQSLAVDLVVHFVKSRGTASAKVFKLGEIELAPRGTETLGKNVSIAVHTTRKPYAGRHRVEALVNGERFEVGAFTVTAAASSGGGRASAS
jgi:3-methyladenine DNA glycosylase AlkC